MIVVITMDKIIPAWILSPRVCLCPGVRGTAGRSQQKVLSILLKSLKERNYDWTDVKNEIRETLGRFFYEKMKRRPMLLPIIMEV